MKVDTLGNELKPGDKVLVPTGRGLREATVVCTCCARGVRVTKSNRSGKRGTVYDTKFVFRIRQGEGYYL